MVKSILLLSSNLLSKAFIFVVNIYVARHTSLEGYGFYSLLRGTVNLFETSASSSLNPILIREVAKKNEDKARHAELMLSIGFIFCAFIGLLSLGIVYKIIQVFDYKYSFLQASVCSLLIVVTIANGMCTSICIGVDNVKAVAVSSIISVFVSSMIMLIIIMQDMDSATVFYGMGILISFNVLEFICKRRFIRTQDWRNRINVFNSLKKYFRSIRKMAPFGSVLLASILNALCFWFCRFLLGTGEGGLVQLGVFDASFQFILVVMLGLNAFASIFLANVTIMLQDFDRLRSYLLQYLGLSILFCFFVGAGIYSSSGFLIGVFGSEFSDSSLKILCLLPFLYSLALIGNRLSFALMNEKILLIISAVSSVIMLVVFLFVQSEQSADSLAYAYLAYYLCSVVGYAAYYGVIDSD